MAYTQVKFYFLPKERIANLLNKLSKQDDDGSITCQLYGRDDVVILVDYLIPQEIVSTPQMSAYVGKVGTRAEINASSSNMVSICVRDMDVILKKYEI